MKEEEYVREGDKISYKRGGGVCLFICDEDLSQSEKEERNCDRKLAENSYSHK